jgi:aldehyde:ferredoxin oxidoreductase
MLKSYYRIRGWSREGIPTKARLKKLGLEDYGV